MVTGIEAQTLNIEFFGETICETLFIKSTTLMEIYITIALISHASKVMLNYFILQAWLQQYMNCELPDIQAGFRKGRGTRNQIANICWIIEKARVPEKHLVLLY